MKYEIALSVDGNHSVSVTGDSEGEMTVGLIWARDVHRRLRALSKREPAAPEVGVPSTPSPAGAEPPGPPPLCGIHQVAMVWQQGRREHFWSCHERNPDGGWCTFKPITVVGQEPTSV